MEKETYILQTTRAGRLPTNAVFTDEAVARAETDRAQQSGAFEHIRLVHLVGTGKTVLVDSDGQKQPGKASAKAMPASTRSAKKQVTSAQLIGRTTTLITVLLIGVVLAYAVGRFMAK